VRVYVVDGYGLELMAFYMFTCLVLKSMLSMNFGTSQRARIKVMWHTYFYTLTIHSVFPLIRGSEPRGYMKNVMGGTVS